MDAGALSLARHGNCGPVRGGSGRSGPLTVCSGPLHPGLSGAWDHDRGPAADIPSHLGRKLRARIGGDVAAAGWQNILPIVVVVWLLGVIAFSIRLATGWRFTVRLRTASHPAPHRGRRGQPDARFAHRRRVAAIAERPEMQSWICFRWCSVPGPWGPSAVRSCHTLVRTSVCMKVALVGRQSKHLFEKSVDTEQVFVMGCRHGEQRSMQGPDRTVQTVVSHPSRTTFRMTDSTIRSTTGRTSR